MAHDLMRPGERCYRRILSLFGPGILTRGRIDRTKLADHVFKDPHALKALEDIIHPEVIKETKKKIRDLKKTKGVRAIVLDVPLLFESGMDRLCDVTLLVKAPRQTQISRTVTRLRLSRQEAARRLKRQWPTTKKMRLADVIVNNKGKKKQLKDTVTAVWDRFVR